MRHSYNRVLFLRVMVTRYSCKNLHITVLLGSKKFHHFVWTDKTRTALLPLCQCRQVNALSESVRLDCQIVTSATDGGG